MQNGMPIDLKKIRTKLRSYERKFKGSPHDRDGSGVRFLMGSCKVQQAAHATEVTAAAADTSVKIHKIYIEA